eukprot:gene16374-16552_t
MGNILIIEDDVTFSQMLQNFLQKKGHSIITAANIKSGLKYFDEQKFDLLLLDYRLPDGTGMEVLERMNDTANHTPVVIMTSLNDVRTAVKAIRSGAFDYITKPVNPDELLMIMRSALQGKNTEPEPKSSGPEFIKGISQLSGKLHEYIDVQANRELERNVTSISPEALQILHRYDWPGNLRELKNVIKRMVLLSQGDEADADTLPDEMLFMVSNQVSRVPESDLKAQNEVNEKKLIEKTLQDPRRSSTSTVKPCTAK